MLLNCVQAEKTGLDFLRDCTNAHTSACTQTEAESLIRCGILTRAFLVKMTPLQPCSAVHCVNLLIIFNSFPLFSLYASLFAAAPFRIYFIVLVYNWIGSNGKQRPVRSL